MRKGRTAGTVAMLVAALLCGGAALAAEQFPSGPNHRGVATFDPYLVFPENRPGNGVYLDNRLVYENNDQTIVDVLALPAAGRFAYYALGPQGEGKLGIYVTPKDGKPRIDEITPGFFHVTVVVDGVVYKKLYRVLDHNLLDLLPNSKTADGPTPGPVGVIFYHVATAVRDTQDGQATHGFGLMLHLALFQDEHTRHLDYLITNARPDLKITWLDDSSVQVTLADGRTQTISVSQFK
jgi:hypothetical protein